MNALLSLAVSLSALAVVALMGLVTARVQSSRAADDANGCQDALDQLLGEMCWIK